MAARLFIADNGGNRLWELDPDGANTQGTSRTLPSALAPAAMTAYQGRLLIADNANDALWQLDPDGADGEGTRLRGFPSGLHSPIGMAVFNERLFIIEYNGALWEIDPNGSVRKEPPAPRHQVSPPQED